MAERNMTKRQQYVAYANEIVIDYRDEYTGEVNATKLGEAIVIHFNVNENDDTPFEVSAEVADRFAPKHKRGL